MSMFSDFPTMTDADSISAASPLDNGVQVSLPQTNYGYGGFKLLTVQLEECNRQLGKHNKLLKKSCKKQKKDKRRKRFFEKFSDAFCKSLPAILTTVTTAVVSVLFRTPSNRKALHAA